MVKQKRKRGVPYLDSVDLEILEFLDMNNYNNNIKGRAVLDIAKHLDIQHNNLKPHIDKLLKLGLIVIQDISSYKLKGKKTIKEKRVGLSSIKARNEYIYDNIYPELKKDAMIEMQKENDYFNSVLKVLREIRSYFLDKEDEEYLNIDLRELETQERFLNTKIGTLSIKDNKQMNNKNVISRSKNRKKKPLKSN